MNYADRVKDTTTTTGTGNITVSGTPALRCLPFSLLTVGKTYPILIEGTGSSTEFELSECTILSATTFSRGAVIKSSNGDAPVNFSAGTKDVCVTLSASQIAKFSAVDDVAFAQTVPLNTGGTCYMPSTAVAGALTFVPASSPVRGSLVYLELKANGTNTPDFSAFRQWGGSLGWDNTNGIWNQVQFFHDGKFPWVSISQEIDAVPDVVDTTAPTALSASVGNASPTVVAIAMSEALDSGFVPAASAFTVSGHTVSSVGISGSTISLTVSSAFVNGEAARTVSYTQPGTNQARDLAGNQLANFSSLAITNNVGVAATAPGAPTIGTATAGDGVVNVAYTAPASNGGATITSYTATLYKVSDNAAAGTATGTANPLPVTATNGVAVYAKVKATNSVGTGAESAASNSVTPQVAVSNRMLDGLAISAVAAYSVARKLRTAYSGSAIRVRDTNNVFTDIGFDGNGEIDMTALAAAVAAAPGNNLYIATIYDQSGNGFDVTQSTNGNQWLVVSSGVNRTLGGKLTWKPEGYAPGSLSTAAISATLGAAAAVASGNTQTSGAGIVSGAGGNSTDPLYAPSATGGALAGRYNNVAAATLEVNGALASTMPTTGANALYSDGEPRAVTGIKLGVDSGNAGGWSGNISEVVLWAAALSSGDQAAVYNSQKTFYGTP